MASRTSNPPRWLICLALLLAHVASVSAQTITPTNNTAASFFRPSNDTEIVLQSQMVDGTHFTAQLQPLTSGAGYLQSVSDLMGHIDIDGSLTFTDAQSVEYLNKDEIAFISCDNASYAGYMNSASILTFAAGQAPQAIILYSIESTNCDYSSGPSFDYRSLYSMTRQNDSAQTLNAIQGAGSALNAKIVLWNTTKNAQAENGTSSDNSNGSNNGPSTAVPLVILYSVTGVITAAFVAIIVSGAVRAHRHPERYGPRNALGRPRQSRARGIARAMLETLPIVKFGEREEDKCHDGDIELGASGKRGDVGQEAGVIEGSAPTDTAGALQDGQPREGQQVKVIEDGVAAQSSSPEEVPPTAGHAETQTSSDDGLVCSICTEDFVKGQDTRVLPCKHMFHPECIDPWLLNVSGTCPLCRVDLRPTTSRTSEDETNHDENTTENHGRTFTLPPHILDHHTAESRRSSRHAVSLFLQNTLNVHRMRDATPEERVAALRIVREHHRNLEEAARADEGNNWRNRLGGRLRTRFLGGRPGASASGLSGEGMQEQESETRACENGDGTASPEAETREENTEHSNSPLPTPLAGEEQQPTHQSES